MPANDDSKDDPNRDDPGQEKNTPIDSGGDDPESSGIGDGTDAANDDGPLEAEQLALDDDDADRLPWLDADDDDGDDTTDGGRILGFSLLGLIALIAIVGGIWWSNNRKPDNDMVAQGSLIPAPSQPYKEAPKSPGGKTFEGTGDTAFAVSEGQTRPAKLGESGASAPSVDLAKPTASATATAAAAKPTTGASASASASPAVAATAVSGPVVQVGAYSTRASAEAAWSRMAQQYSALSGLKHQVLEGKADIGTVYRLQVLTGEASTLCGRLKSAGLACQVK